MTPEKVAIVEHLERLRGSKVIIYVTGDRAGMETSMHSEVLNFFIDHLDAIGKQEKISLFLYSRGGEIMSAWSIVNLIRQFCSRFEVIVPFKAQSAATLLALGADEIVMTKQAHLGPIDPSTNGAFNPLPNIQTIPGQTLPLSVEAVASFFDFAKNELSINEPAHLNEIYMRLIEKIHPVAIGDIYRSRNQIKMLANKLLSYHMGDEERRKTIINILATESGSHDYTINRREALEDMRLPIIKPDDELYATIKGLYDHIRNELRLNDVFNPVAELGGNARVQNEYRRAIVESIMNGSDVFISDYTIVRQQITLPNNTIGENVNININHEGWRHETNN